MTDNGSCYRSYLFRDTLEASKHHPRPDPTPTPPAQRQGRTFNRTLLDEWAYVQVYNSEQERIDTLAKWIHTYNHHHNHTAIGGPPISRATNLAGHHI